MLHATFDAVEPCPGEPGKPPGKSVPDAFREPGHILWAKGKIIKPKIHPGDAAIHPPIELLLTAGAC